MRRAPHPLFGLRGLTPTHLKVIPRACLRCPGPGQPHGGMWVLAGVRPRSGPRSVPGRRVRGVGPPRVPVWKLVHLNKQHNGMGGASDQPPPMPFTAGENAQKKIKIPPLPFQQTPISLSEHGQPLGLETYANNLHREKGGFF